MSFGNGQTDDNRAKFARYLAAARAGNLLRLAELGDLPTSVPKDELSGFLPQHTQPNHVSTSTAVATSSGLSPALTTAGVWGTTFNAQVSYGTISHGFPMAPPATTYWLGDSPQATHLSDHSLSLTQIGSVHYGIGSAFTQIDHDREQRAQFEADCALVLLPPELGPKIQSRLNDLIAIAREEGLETAGPAPDSVRASVNFLAAMSASISVQLPSITLDSNGYVICEWRKGNGRSAVLRFLSDGSIGCSLTTLSAGGRRNTWFAIVTAENLRSTVLSNPAWRDLIRQ